MATGIINPYALSGVPSYEDECLADNPLGLWMLDEPYGNNVAANKGTVSGGDGTYYGNMGLSTSRGLRTVFNLDVAGASVANSNGVAGFKNGSVTIPYNAAFNSGMSAQYSANTWEWVTRVDHQAPSNEWQWMIRRYPGGPGSSLGVANSTNNYSLMIQRAYIYSGGGMTFNSSYGPANSFWLGSDAHHVVTFGTSNPYVRWYINGNLYWVASIASYYSQEAATTAPIVFGTYYGNTGGANYFLRGAMGGVALYDYALSPSRIVAHYQALLT